MVNVGKYTYMDPMGDRSGTHNITATPDLEPPWKGESSSKPPAIFQGFLDFAENATCFGWNRGTFWRKVLDDGWIDVGWLMVGLMLDAWDKKSLWLSSESWHGSKFEPEFVLWINPLSTMRRILFVRGQKMTKESFVPRIMDGRAMTKQQLRLEELAEEGRRWAKHPELKPKPRPEGRGMAFAMAHLDELLEKGKLQKQAREVASPQESDEVFHDAVDLSDNEKSIWMDANETSPSGEMPTDTAESADVMERKLGGGEQGEQGIESTEIVTVPDFTHSEVEVGGGEQGEQGIESTEIVTVPEVGGGEQGIESTEIVSVPDFTHSEVEVGGGEQGEQGIESTEIVTVPDFTHSEVEVGGGEQGEQGIESTEIVTVPDFTHSGVEVGGGEQGIESTEIVTVPDFAHSEVEVGGGEQGIESTEIVSVPDFTHSEVEVGGGEQGEQGIESTEIVSVPEFTHSELGFQQNQNPPTEAEAEREDFSMWSFLRAAGLVCGCWGRWSCSWTTAFGATVAHRLIGWFFDKLKSLRKNEALIDPAPKLRLSVQMALTRTESKEKDWHQTLCWENGNTPIESQCWFAKVSLFVPSLQGWEMPRLDLPAIQRIHFYSTYEKRVLSMYIPQDTPRWRT